MTFDSNGVCQGTHYRQLWSYTLFGYKIERWVRQEDMFTDSKDKHFVINGVKIPKKESKDFVSIDLLTAEERFAHIAKKIAEVVVNHSNALERQEKLIRVKPVEFLMCTQTPDVDDGEYAKMLNDLFKQGWELNGSCQHCLDGEKWISRKALIRRIA